MVGREVLRSARKTGHSAPERDDRAAEWVVALAEAIALCRRGDFGSPEITVVRVFLGTFLMASVLVGPRPPRSVNLRPYLATPTTRIRRPPHRPLQAAHALLAARYPAMLDLRAPALVPPPPLPPNSAIQSFPAASTDLAMSRRSRGWSPGSHRCRLLDEASA